MSQKQDILDYLRDRGSITKREAAEAFNCWNLPARILELRVDDGIPVITRTEPNVGRGTHARYVLEQTEIFV